MKKVSFVLVSVLVALMLASCATLPKEVTQGNNIVVGKVIMNCENYKGDYSSLNGIHTKGNVIKFKSKSTDKIIMVDTNANGYFKTNKLSSDEEYWVCEVRHTAKVSNGEYWTYSTFPEDKIFSPSDMAITNLGIISFVMDPDNARWTIGEFDVIERDYIDDLVAGTNWEHVSVVRRNFTIDYEEWIKK